MAKLRIKGWDTGSNKLKMTEILIEKIGLDKKGADELEKAISEGRTMSLNIEDNNYAEELYQDLIKVGALVELV